MKQGRVRVRGIFSPQCFISPLILAFSLEGEGMVSFE
jgi:hypothetical protein